MPPSDLISPSQQYNSDQTNPHHPVFPRGPPYTALWAWISTVRLCCTPPHRFSFPLGFIKLEHSRTPPCVVGVCLGSDLYLSAVKARSLIIPAPSSLDSLPVAFAGLCGWANGLASSGSDWIIVIFRSPCFLAFCRHLSPYAFTTCTHGWDLWWSQAPFIHIYLLWAASPLLLSQDQSSSLQPPSFFLHPDTRPGRRKASFIKSSAVHVYRSSDQHVLLDGVCWINL